MDSRNSIRAIVAYDSNAKPKRNRSGNLLTIDLQAALNRLFAQGKLDARCRVNIETLIEIRDNAIHFVNNDISLQKKTMELGTACLQNYLSALREWFNRDMSQFNFYLMPLSFYPQMNVDNHTIIDGSELALFLKHIYELEQTYPSSVESNYNVTLNYEVRIKKATNPDYTIFVTDKSEEGMAVRIEEEDVFKTKYPMTYKTLIAKLMERYSDFKQGKKFYDIKRKLENPTIHGERFCRFRYLDSFEKKGSKKPYYSPEIIKELDKYYTKR